MASARIPYSKASALGQQIAAYLRAGVDHRTRGEELRRVVEKYIDDNAGIATDSGMSEANVALFRNLLNKAVSEVAETAVVQVNVGQQTGTRELLDAMG